MVEEVDSSISIIDILNVVKVVIKINSEKINEIYDKLKELNSF